jgi:hypothetical protein
MIVYSSCTLTCARMMLRVLTGWGWRLWTRRRCASGLICCIIIIYLLMYILQFAANATIAALPFNVFSYAYIVTWVIANAVLFCCCFGDESVHKHCVCIEAPGGMMLFIFRYKIISCSDLVCSKHTNCMLRSVCVQYIVCYFVGIWCNCGREYYSNYLTILTDPSIHGIVCV